MGVHLSRLPRSPPPATLHDAELALATQYTAVAFLSIAVWDSLLCFHAEQAIIWRFKTTPMKCVYLVTRYLGLAAGAMLVAAHATNGLSDSRACTGLSRATMAVATLATSSGSIVCAYRIAALYSFNRPIEWLVGTAIAVCLILQCCALSNWQGLVVSTGVVGCFPSSNPSLSWPALVYWCPAVAIAALFLVLLVDRATVRERSSERYEGRSADSAFTRFWRDGARFQLMVVAVTTTAMILSFVSPPALSPSTIDI
ncbi:hypothetical protein JCM10212_006600 [Sporobolomyces blumeae]